MDGMRIHGLEELKTKWSKGGKVIFDSLKGAADRAVKYVHSTVPAYPPKPITSTYERTEQLGRAMTTDVKMLGGTEFVATIGNKVEYAPWVISRDRVGSRGPQAKFHKAHGWWTLQEVVEKASDQVYEIFHEAVIAILRKL